MKALNIKIGIKSLDQALNDFQNTADKLMEGKAAKKKSGVYFTSVEAFRKALTPKRMELLHIIRTKKPESMRNLARIAHRDIKNVSDDVKYLSGLGLLELNETGNHIETAVNYDKILLEISV